MNQKQARQQASVLVGQLIQQYIDAAALYEDMNESDADRVYNALESIRDETRWRFRPEPRETA